MKKTLKRKTVKGMTLVEIIIAMLVLGIMGVVMVQIAQAANKMLISTNHLNNKTEAEAPISAVADTTKLQSKVTAVNAAAADEDDEMTNGETAVTFTVGTYGSVNANRYDTAAAAKASGKSVDSSMNANLQFYVITP